MASKPISSAVSQPARIHHSTLRPVTRSIPRSTSTATLSRANSTLALTPATRLPTISSSRPSPRALGSGTTGIPLPKSSLATVKSTSTLRQPPSQSSLRPSRLAQPSVSTLKPSEGAGGRPTMRRVPSTNFKENFFAPPPSAPPVPHRSERKGLVKKKSQLLPVRRVISNVETPSRDVLAQARVLAPRPSLPRSVSPLPPVQKPGLSRRAPTPSAHPSQQSSRESPTHPFPYYASPHPPFTIPSSTTHRTPLHKPSLTLLQPPSPLPSHLTSSPWKGPRTSIDQIKDTEISITEDDSVDLSSGVVSRFDPEESKAGRWLSVSTLRRPPSRAQTTAAITGSEAGMEALRKKERQIEMLQKELSLERQMLGRLGREAADREEENQRAHEAELAGVAKKLAKAERARAADKCQAVIRAAADLQANVDAAREAIKRIRATLDR